MKNAKYSVVIFLLITVLFSTQLVGAFELDVKSAILIEAETGQVLYEKNSEEELPPASMTKIMTLLLAMESLERDEISLDEKVVISDYASSMGGSQIYLAANDEVSVEKLLKAVTIASANDASVALGEVIGGTYSSFVDMMNEKADELEMKDTNFVNSTGLPAENHYTSARDITKMSRELVKYEKILEWGQIWTETIELPNREAMLVNTNSLINSYTGLDGIKTGHTSEAGYCLAATAKRSDIRLISVVMDTESEAERNELTNRLLNYGYNNFSQEKFMEKDEEIQEIQIPGGSERFTTGQAAEDLTVMVSRSERDEYSTEFMLNNEMEAPVEKGDVLGQFLVKKDGDTVNQIDILATEDVGRANIFVRLWRAFVNWIGSIISS
ncbi:MAG: D-alanyl-D-alanine carboxypeptidase family protein [Halanaerobiaceae bacterium]